MTRCDPVTDGAGDGASAAAGVHRHQQRRERRLLELVEPDIHVGVVLGAVERLPPVVGDLLQAPLRHIGEPREVQGHAKQAGKCPARENIPEQRVFAFGFPKSELRVGTKCPRCKQSASPSRTLSVYPRS